MKYAQAPVYSKKPRGLERGTCYTISISSGKTELTHVPDDGTSSFIGQDVAYWLLLPATGCKGGLAYEIPSVLKWMFVYFCTKL